MDTESQYYNARPSKISNLGADVAGAKRMNFDTYETAQEKAERKAKDQALSDIKAQIKDLVLSDAPDVVLLKELLETRFRLQYGQSLDDALVYITSNRMILPAQEINKLIDAYNRARRELRRIDYYGMSQIKAMRRKYGSKESFVELTGKKSAWKSFELTQLSETDVNFLKETTNAVQFGNSISDNERAYIITKLSSFLRHWRGLSGIYARYDLSDISWSFGARGKAGSVAYYQPAQKIISVNRDNIGSLIHEVGHHIDYTTGIPSKRISYKTIMDYRRKLTDMGITGKHLTYLLRKDEIFARAFEAYCYKKEVGFSVFAQYGSQDLPDLNDDLIAIIEGLI